MVDPKWTRWIKSSINLHFSEGQTTVRAFVEGQEWNFKDQEKSYAEVRVQGPQYNEISNKYYKIELVVGILASALIIDKLYEIDRLVGIYQSKMGDIIVKKYGDGEDYFGCLTLRSDVDPPIETVIFGQSEVDKRIILGSVEGQYRMELSI